MTYELNRKIKKSPHADKCWNHGAASVWLNYLYKLAYLLVFCTAISLFTSCKKELGEPKFELVDLRETGRINKIVSLANGRMYAMGGQRWSRGFLYESRNSGQDWQSVQFVNDTSDYYLKDIILLENGTLVCTGFGGQVFFSADGDQWSFIRHLSWGLFSSLAPLEGNNYLLGGGADYFSGDLARSVHGQWWDIYLDSFPIIIQDLTYLSAHQKYVAVGYGAVFEGNQNALDWQRTRISGDHFTACSFPTDSRGYICGFSGSIWSYDPQDGRADMLRPTFGAFESARGWRDIDFFDELHGIVVGRGGALMYTKDGGQNWQSYQLPVNGDLFAVHMISEEACWVGGEGAFFAKVHLGQN